MTGRKKESEVAGNVSEVCIGVCIKVTLVQENKAAVVLGVNTRIVSINSVMAKVRLPVHPLFS